MWPEEYNKKVRFELECIHKNFESFTPLFQLIEIRKPDLIETAAVSSLLHSFYTGLEKIMSLTAKIIDRHIPQGNHWHKELLIQMSQKNKHRREFFNEEIFQKLLKYLNFRHFQRNSYEFILDWQELKPLFIEMKPVFDDFQKQILDFLNQKAEQD